MKARFLRKPVLLTFLAGLGLLPFGAAAADEPDEPADKPKLDAGLLGGIEWRHIGPALMSGRIADIALDPAAPNTWYVAAGSGNLWKTENAGTTWKPIFERYGSYSIGCVTLDPSHPNTVWVGAGEAVGGRHVGYGDGVYRSRDGGRSFENLGLKATEHIARILVDPRNSDVIYVAAQGPLWSPGGERGLFKSTNGGRTWTCILARGPYTGVTEVAFDPRNPDVLYAATHQRHRTVWALVNGGPESGIHKSVDGGATWRELKQGLPGGDKGKIALAVSPQQPDVVYASIELAGRTGGFWRSADGGESWRKMNDIISGGTGPHYYQEIFCDPHRFDVVYQMDVRLSRTPDGGATWETVESPAKHVDNHAIAFHPQDPDFLLVGCDGGLYRSNDRGGAFTFFPNLPLTQFYKVAADYDEPFYHVVGGTQDNSTQYGPARTADASGIRNSDWQIIIGGDGHDGAIDPENPNLIYGESQEGYIRRYDRLTGETTSIRPRPEPDEEDLRFNWDSPILISPHSPARLYFGSKKLHRSDDHGDTWHTISPDLSRGQERYQRKHMDRVWSLDAVYDTLAMSQYGNLTSISESPVQEGLIYVGTDDGLIQVTEDGGGTWRRVERIYGIPEEAFVNDVKADRHDADVVYAVFDHHKTGDFKPYLVRSNDRGRSWESITGDLPDRQILWRIEQDHVKPELLFLGAEFGVYCSLDAGKHWLQLKGGVPTIPFRDLEIQRRENDLIGASFGRGFFVLDDYRFLRDLSAEAIRDEELILFPVRRAWLYSPTRELGGGRGSQGDQLFTAPNPPFGAVFTYYLRDSLKTRQQERKEQERKAWKAGKDTPPPAWETLEAEAREERPTLEFIVTDAAGEVIDRMTGPASAGLHRISWNLCHASSSSARGAGPWVVPGDYRVRVEKRVRGEVVGLGEPQTFEVVALREPALRGASREEALAFYRHAEELARTVRAAAGRSQEILGQLGEITRTIEGVAADRQELRERARAMELRLTELRLRLVGGTVKAQFNEPDRLPIMDRLNNALAGQRSTYGPTGTQRHDFDVASAQYAAIAGELRELTGEAWRELERQLDEANIPWTAGRPIPPR
ncbi:MAG: glycosyl hydrolase [Verrucomicrobiales bacterium]|nr:glycosyl hydrolase [Verrucomicrobiales bacterium]